MPANGEHMSRMRPGMSLAEREELRARLLDREIQEARVRASTIFVIGRCYRAQVPADHAACRAELASGCLCPCHDPRPVGDQDEEGPVSPGQSAEEAADAIAATGA